MRKFSALLISLPVFSRDFVSINYVLDLATSDIGLAPLPENRFTRVSAVLRFWSIPLLVYR